MLYSLCKAKRFKSWWDKDCDRMACFLFFWLLGYVGLANGVPSSLVMAPSLLFSLTRLVRFRADCDHGERLITAQWSLFRPWTMRVHPKAELPLCYWQEVLPGTAVNASRSAWPGSSWRPERKTISKRGICTLKYQVVVRWESKREI